MIIGIEGPAGAGKSTMARTVATEIGAIVIEGGAWYRALTYEALRRKIDVTNTQAIIDIAETMIIIPVNDPNGQTGIMMNDVDVTDELYEAVVDRSVATIAQQLPVRSVIEPKIIEAVRAQDDVIIVGRHLRKALPEAAILRLVIEDHEVERRHRLRGGETDRLVASRNARDAATAHLLGMSTDGVVEIDVTTMTPSGQADALRQFIKMVSVKRLPNTSFRDETGDVSGGQGARQT